MTAARAVVDVAVGVLIRDDGAVLLGQRPPGKPYAGWWEFPGGKLEAGESVAGALARELHEELGIAVERCDPWVVREFVYPHAAVRLHFRRVSRWRGQPQGREGQAFVWQRPDAIDVAPLLPATVPVIGWLRLPADYAISDAAGMGEARFLQALERRLAAGLRLVQLREKSLSADAFDRLFRVVRARCSAAGARLLINSAHDRSYWRAADGVHLTSPDLAAAAERPALPLVAASCHDAAELALAGRLQLDFAVLGPVLPTRSHPGATPLGWPGFAAAAGDARLPVYALGGVGPQHRQAALAAGAQGLAGIGAFWG
ncbi:MAG TPA: Nudix family hydrolase [Burkholderiaceae bacterium]|nr:Nudix family hydrolase [Burkholderiaceae bacterium]